MILNRTAKTLALVAFCSALFAGPIDGRWKVEIIPKTEGPAKKAAKNRLRTATLEFKTKGNQLTGTLAAKKLSSALDKGLVDGNSFSFATKLTTKKGERTIYWKGTIDGDTLKGTQSAKEGAKRGQQFTAKRTA